MMCIYKLEGRTDSEAGRLLVDQNLLTDAEWQQQLQPMHKHQRPVRVYRSLMKLCTDAYLDPCGCIHHMPAETFNILLANLMEASGGCNSMLSSVSTGKLPFAYVSVVHWAVRVSLLIYAADFAIDMAERSIYYGHDMPFTCQSHAIDVLTTNMTDLLAFGQRRYHERCGTMPYLAVLSMTSFMSYVLLGFMDLQALLLNPYSSTRGWRNTPFAMVLQTTTDDLQADGQPHGSADVQYSSDLTRITVVAMQKDYNHQMARDAATDLADGAMPPECSKVPQSAPNCTQAAAARGGRTIAQHR